MIKIKKMENGYLVELPNNIIKNSEFGDIMGNLLKVVEKQTDPIMASIKEQNEPEEAQPKMRIDSGVYIFPNFEKVLAFLDLWYKEDKL